MVSRVTDLRTGEGEYAALDDRMLVLDFQAGHPEAFVEIHRRYGGLVRHVCRRFLPNQQDTDEAVQESMIRVFQGLFRFNGQFALQPWVARIATNVSLDVIRGRTRRPQLDERSIDEHAREDAGEGPEEAVERLVQRDLVLSVLSDLPEAHRNALVLRELEGHSHREIAEAMGMTPAQAKALIHRAKGSFRRRWMETVAERSGLAALAFAPLIWFANLAGLFRRVADRLGQAAIATDVATGGAASTVAPVATVTTGERVVAAAVTLLVAGSVSVGAVAISHHSHQEPKRIAAAAPAVVQPSPSIAAAPPASDPPVKTDRGQHPGILVPPVVDPSPSPVEVSPTPDPSVSPTPDPSVTPTPEPSPDPVPAPPPAPSWSGSFDVAWTSNDRCDCGPGVSMTSSRSTGDLRQEGGTLEAAQSIAGAARDAEGNAAWALTADLDAQVTRNSGSLSVSFTLEKDGVTTQFVASGDMAQVTGDLGAGEPLIYVFTGSYNAVGPSDASPIRTSGNFSATLAVWADGSTVYGADLSVLA